MYNKIRSLPERFIEAMDDDFNTARALGYIFDAVRVINGYYTDKAFKATKEALFVLNEGKTIMREVGNVLGLFMEEPDEYFEQDRRREAEKLGLDIDEIESLIKERWEARVARDWRKADEIRDLLISKKIILKDTHDRTSWSVA
jgi:cysteinyl-tRNA synthetase